MGYTDYNQIKEGTFGWLKSECSFFELRADLLLYYTYERRGVLGLNLMSIPTLLERQEKGVLRDHAVIGLIKGEVEAPASITTMHPNQSEDPIFVLVDLIGLRRDKNYYLTRGSVMACVNRETFVQLTAMKKERYFVELSGGSLRSLSYADLGRDFIMMCAWRREEGGGNYLYTPVSLKSMGREAHPTYFDIVLRASKNNWMIQYPVAVPFGFRDATPAYEFNFLTVLDKQPDTKVEASAELGVMSAPWGKVEGDLNGDNGFMSGSKGAETSASAVNVKANRPNKSRNFLASIPPIYSEIESSLILAEDNVKLIIDKMRSLSDIEVTEEGLSEEEEQELLEKLSAEDDFNDHITFVGKQIVSSWSRARGETGRALFKNALEYVFTDLRKLPKPTIQGVTILEESLMMNDVKLAEIWRDGVYVGEDKFIRKLVEERTNIYLAILNGVLGVRYPLQNVYESALESFISFYRVLIKNPYYLCFLDAGLSLSDMDKLAMAMGFNLLDPSISRLRNVSYMHTLMLSADSDMVSESTTIPFEKVIKQISAGIVLNKVEYDNLNNYGMVITPNRLEQIQYYIRSETSNASYMLPTNGWSNLNRTTGKMLLPLQDVNSLSIVKDYLKSGLGVLFTTPTGRYLSDYILVKKELYVYNRLRELCAYSPVEISKEDAQEVLNMFETAKHKEYGLPDDKPFKLEERQKDGVNILTTGYRAMALTGPAGSGKTTTAEVVISAVEILLGIKRDGIYFCAPTGKAANRLKEVVKRRTRTINSLFNIMGENMVLRDEGRVPKADNILALIMDETSMPNINLMYEVILRIKDGTYLFFLGDVEQLAPIGFGKPFASFLKFLPCVELNVTKRASEGSYITRNAEKVIYESDGVIADLVDGSDFRNINFKDASKTAGVVKSIIDYHLGRTQTCEFKVITNPDGSRLMLEPDDIQVISPINKKDWGINALNRVLQDSFNPIVNNNKIAVIKKRFDDQLTQFRIGDRVAHIAKNLNSMVRFIKDGDTYSVWLDRRDKPVLGIANGELGKVVDVVYAENVTIEPCIVDKEDITSPYQRSGSTAFVIVAYSDTDIDTGEMQEFYVLYLASVEAELGNEYHMTSLELDYLDLSYAATVHRMQGSQAKMVLCVYHRIGGTFITRNMVYTGLTRAKSQCYMIGDILGRDSAVNRARRLQAMDLRMSVLDLLG